MKKKFLTLLFLLGTTVLASWGEVDINKLDENLYKISFFHEEDPNFFKFKLDTTDSSFKKHKLYFSTNEEVTTEQLQGVSVVIWEDGLGGYINREKVLESYEDGVYTYSLSASPNLFSKRDFHAKPTGVQVIPSVMINDVYDLGLKISKVKTKVSEGGYNEEV